MHKKLAAALTIAIFLMSTLAIVGPVQAHFTLGNLTGTYRYRTNDFDPHVAGPVGYVWPGGGANAYSGVPAPGFGASASSAYGPGYQSPYPGFNPPGAPSQSWYQLESNTYAPFGAVLTGSTGDLIFALNATCTPQYWNDAEGCAHDFNEGNGGNGVTTSEIQDTLSNDLGWDTWFILIPPEFTVPDASQVVSTLSNDGNQFTVAKLSPYDRYAPGWTMVALSVDANGAGQTGTHPSFNHEWINFTQAGEWYYARINGVTAPTTAGRYFFKMFLGAPSYYYGVGPTLVGGGAGSENPDVWVPPQNWPVMLVKGEVDPAIVTGTLRYAGYNATLYQQPIAEAGMVWAKMTTRLDPYTGAQRPDLPTVDAQTFVNATAHGHYEVEGMAPGIYDLYASAAGYPQTLCASGVTVLKGQSLHFDCYLQPGPVIHGQVFSKHQFGDEPWPGSPINEETMTDDTAEFGQYIRIGLYDAPTLNNVPDPSANLVSWSPLPCVAGGQENYYGRRDAAYCGDPHDGSAIAFPWHEYSTDSNVISQALGGAFNGYSRDVAMSSYLDNAFLTSDPQGVGPAQKWFVNGGTTDPFAYQFGLKGEYGAPRDLSGEVPQVYATWVNGLTPGRYYVRANIFRYVQTALDGATFQEYFFDITPNEWAGDVSVPLDLRLSSWINKTVYFHNTVNTIQTGPITTGAGALYGNLRGADGTIYAHNTTNLGYDDLYYTCAYNARVDGGHVDNSATFDSYTSSATGVQYTGSGESGAPGESCPGNENFLNRAHYNADSIASGRAVFQFWGLNDTWGGVNYGIPSGTYTPEMFALGYYPQSPEEQVSVTLSGNPTSISDHLFRAPGFNVTVTSIDWERPRVSRPWVWAECQSNFGSEDYCYGAEIDVGFYPVVNGTAGPYALMAGGDVGLYPSTVGYNRYNTQTYDLYGLTQGDKDDNANVCNPLVVDGAETATPGYPENSDCTEMDGGGRDVLAQPYGNYGAHGAFFGWEATYGFVGGYTGGTFGFLTASALNKIGLSTCGLEVSCHFDEGQYNLRAFTYGYIQDKDYTAFAQNGQVADMKINLLIGVNVTLDILFKKESIITGTLNNMSARVRLFNDQGQLVAEWMSSEGTYVDRSGHAIAANGALNNAADVNGEAENPDYPFGNKGDGIMAPATGLNPYNYVPGNTTLLHVLMAGFPSFPWDGGGIGGTSFYGDPVFTPGGCYFGADCYPAAYGQYPFPDNGILGAPDYTGGWTAEVDFVNWYANNSAYRAFDSQVPSNAAGTTYGQYYPPVQGLLMGEDYHIIPGTTATSGISFTEDGAVDPTFLGHSMAPNHLGPYSQQGVWQISNAHLSGEASAIFEVDLNGLVSGNALAFTWSNEFRPLSWGLVNVVGANGASFNFYTYDGYYEAYLVPGTYTFSIASPGYASQTFSVVVSPGQAGTGQNLYLEQTNIPVPEFSAIGIVAFSALAASLYLLRRRRR